MTKSYEQSEIDLYEKYFAWKSNDPFPNNIADGYYWSSSDVIHSVEPDFQQEEVINYFVERIIEKLKDLENDKFKFAGFAWDVPDLTGDFWAYRTQSSSGRSRIGLEHWTGVDSSILHSGITHEYSTYSDGRAAFYKTLKTRTREEFGKEPLFLMEPSDIYSDWLEPISNRDDSSIIKGDYITQECNCLRENRNFVDDEQIFDQSLTGQYISRSIVGCTTPDEFTHEANALIAIKAASVGSFFSWYGRFGGTGDMPGYTSIEEVPDRLKLVRCVPIWENENEVKITERNYNYTALTYSSHLSSITKDLIYSMHPKNKNIYAVIITEDGFVQLPSFTILKDIHEVDGYFAPLVNSSLDYFDFRDGKYFLKDNSNFGRGFVFEIDDITTNVIVGTIIGVVSVILFIIILLTVIFLIIFLTIFLKSTKKDIDEFAMETKN